MEITMAQLEGLEETEKDVEDRKQEIRVRTGWIKETA